MDSNRGEIGGGGGLHAPPPLSNPNNIKPRRGRPPGTGRRQKLAAARLRIINPGAEKPRRGRGRPLGSTKHKMAERRHMSTMECAQSHHPAAISFVGDERSGEVEHIIDAIKAKHGDIVEDCIMKSGQVREMSLVCICNVLKYLQEKSLEELEVDSLEHYYEAVRDLEKLNINVKWLLQRLDEIKDAITSRDEAKILGDEKRERVKKLEEERREVERLANENRIFEERVEWLNKSIINGTSKFEKYQNMPDLMDGLI